MSLLLATSWARANASTVPTVRPDGPRLDLSSLASGPVRLHPGTMRVAAKRLRVRFPAGAKQSWTPPAPTYTMRLDMVVTLPAHSGHGEALISGVLNGCAGVQVSVRTNGDGTAIWRSLSAQEGEREGRFRGRRGRISVSNYLARCSVKEGLASLQLKAERFGELRISQVDFEPDTGVGVAAASPPTIELRPSYPDEFAHAREPFELGFTVENAGQAPAHDVVVSLISEDPHLDTRGRRSFRYDSLAATRSGAFRIYPSRQGDYEVQIAVDAANANHPLARIAVPVGPPESDHEDPWLLWVVFAAAAALGLAATARLRRRR